MANQIAARLGVKLALDMAEFSSDVDKAVSENKKLKTAIEREMKAATKEVDRLRFATEDYGKEVSNVTKMQRDLMEGGKYGNAAKASKDFASAMLKEAAALDAVADAQKKANAAKMAGALGGGKLSTYQLQALSYQTTDIITSLAGGQNPMLVLLQQGGQLRDQFGGVKNVFEAFGKVLTPMRLAMLGVGSAVGILSYAFYKGSEESQKFRDSLILTGNMAGVTGDSFKGMANMISNSMNIGIRDTKDILNELIGTGKLTTTSMIPVAEVIAKISKLTGESAQEVAKGLIPSFDGTASSAKKLNEQYNFLTVSQYRHIEALEQQNKKQEAIAYTANLLKERLEGETRQLGYLERAISSVTKAWQEFKDELFNFGRDKTTGEQIAIIAKQMSQNMANAANAPALAESLGKRNAVLLEKYKVLAKQLEEETDKANKKSEEAQKNQDAIRQQNLKDQQNLQFELRQKFIDENVAQAEVGANKVAAIRLEIAKKMATAALKFEKDNIQSGGANYSQKLLLLEQEYQSIRAEGARKETEISRQEAKKFEDRQAAEQLAITTEREKLELFQRNLFLSDTDYQIALDRLKTEKEIADIMRSEMLEKDKQTYVEKQKALQNQREEVAKLGESLKVLKDINAAVFKNMTDALTNFIMTGKLNFRNFAQVVITEIVKIQAAAVAAQASRGIMGAIGNVVGGLFPGVGAAMTYGTNIGSQQTAMLAAQDAGFKAGGGDVMSGSPYIVGDQGPELFIPRNAGTIVPNGNLANAMGNTIVNNYNIDAIDVKSFEERVLGSSNAVWAANQYANKSLAVGRGRT